MTPCSCAASNASAICFAMGNASSIGIAGEHVGNDFDRDLATQLRVAGAIHLAHAACAERAKHFIRGETLTGCERHALVGGWIAS